MEHTLFICESIGHGALRGAIVQHAELAGFAVTENKDEGTFVIAMQDDPMLADVVEGKQIILVSPRPTSIPADARWFNPLTLTHWDIGKLTLADMLAATK